MIIDVTILGFHLNMTLLNPFSFGAQGWTFRQHP